MKTVPHFRVSVSYWECHKTRQKGQLNVKTPDFETCPKLSLVVFKCLSDGYVLLMTSTRWHVPIVLCRLPVSNVSLTARLQYFPAAAINPAQLLAAAECAAPRPERAREPTIDVSWHGRPGVVTILGPSRQMHGGVFMASQLSLSRVSLGQKVPNK